MTVKSDGATRPKPGQGPVVAIGAGGSVFLEARARQLDGTSVGFVLIGPGAPAPGAALQAVLAQGSGKHVIGLPGKQAGEGELLVYNLPGMVSLAAPEASLMSIFPGLREVDRQSFPHIAPDALADVFAGLPDPLTLWLDLPGAESETLDLLAAAGALQRVRDMALRCGVEPFFAGALGRGQIVAKLESLGFALIATDEDDPDWPELCFRADPQARRIRELEVALAARDATLVEVQNLAQARFVYLNEEKAKVAVLETDLTASKDQAATLGKAFDEAKVALASRDKSLADAKKIAEAKTLQATELEDRLRLARDELRRAEGQIEIIKDLLLREPGL
ncbi:MAG: hypothetical protein ACK4HF_17065 [Paracoccaceae bacterium]